MMLHKMATSSYPRHPSNNTLCSVRSVTLIYFTDITYESLILILIASFLCRKFHVSDSRGLITQKVNRWLLCCRSSGVQQSSEPTTPASCRQAKRPHKNPCIINISDTSNNFCHRKIILFTKSCSFGKASLKTRSCTAFV